MNYARCLTCGYVKTTSLKIVGGAYPLICIQCGLNRPSPKGSTRMFVVITEFEARMRAAEAKEKASERKT